MKKSFSSKLRNIFFFLFYGACSAFAQEPVGGEIPEMLPFEKRKQDSLKAVKLINDMQSLLSNGSGNSDMNMSTQPYTINKSLPVGATLGAASVGSSGTAIYTIPIFTCPSTAGMEPSIAISYNSQAGNGILGAGWNISGISSITRTGKNYYTDNKLLTQIEWSQNDNYCLDGVRLVSGSDCYYTEAESFSKIYFKDLNEYGPTWFEVKTKDGKTIEYGRNNNSLYYPEGTWAPLVYNISKVTDATGNYIEYFYETGFGQSQITAIKYTGTKYFAPYNTIEFVYETRTDISNSYIAGYQLMQKKRLSSIIVKDQDNNIARQYNFSYSDYNLSYLTKITEKGKNNIEYNPTVFEYYESTSTTSESITSIPFKDNYNYYAGEFNGDGRTDIIECDKEMDPNSSDYTINIYSQENASSTNFDKIMSTKTSILNGIGNPYAILDLDNDGIDDLLYYNGDYISAKSIDGSGLLHPYSASKLKLFGLGDYDGDGKIEFLTLYPTEYVGISKYSVWDFTKRKFTENSFSEESTGTLHMRFGTPTINKQNFKYTTSAKGIDFNGDGKTDCFYTQDEASDPNNSVTRVYEIANQQGAERKIFEAGFPSKWHEQFFGDFNGDGSTDILTYINGSWQIDFSTGTSYTWNSKNVDLNKSFTIPGVILKEHNLIYIDDFNNDGKADIFEAYFSGNGILKIESVNFNIYYGKGNGEFVKEILGTYNIDNSENNSNINDFFLFGDFNGDGKEDIIFKGNNLKKLYMPSNNFSQNKLKSITNGMSASVNFEYAALTEGTGIYEKQNNATFPVIDYIGSTYVVKSMRSSMGYNTENSENENTYKYHGAKMHMQGKGFLGFNKVESKNVNTGMITIDTYLVEPSVFHTFLSESRTYVLDETTEKNISLIKYTHNIKSIDKIDYHEFINNEWVIVPFIKRYFPYISKTETNNYLTDIKKEVTAEYDESGNCIKINEKIGKINDNLLSNSEIESNTISQYTTIAGNGFKNKLTNASVVCKYKGQDAKKIEKSFTYYSNTGLLKDEVLFPNTSKACTTNYLYKDELVPYFVATGNSTEKRSITNAYDDKYRFVSIITDKLSNAVINEYDNSDGKITKQTSVDNLITKYIYNGFGTLTQIETPLKISGSPVCSLIITDYCIEFNNVNKGTFYSVLTFPVNQPIQINLYDCIGKEIAQAKFTFDGKSLCARREYDSKGRLTRTTDPFYHDATPEWTENKYDVFGRLVKQTYKGLITTYLYNGRKTTVTEPSGKTTTTTNDAAGNPISVEEKKGGTTGLVEYTYNSFGKANEAKTNGNSVTYKYDDYGYLIESTDPNTGITAFEYNIFGEVISKTDAKNIKQSVIFDEIGRVQSKQFTGEQATTYSYITSGNGKGQISQVTAPNGIYQKFTYDIYGRVSKFAEVLPADNETFEIVYGYNGYGLLLTTTYPNKLVITNEYTNNYLTKILADNSMVWQLNSENANGQAVKYTVGNGMIANYTYDNFNNPSEIKYQNGTSIIQNFKYETDAATGNLTFRCDLTRKYLGKLEIELPYTEEFKYDGFDRLTEVKQYHNNKIYSQSYNNNGNIETKTDAGIYSYSDKPHAIDILTPAMGYTPADHDVTYTNFNKADKITEGSKKHEITYGPDEEQIKSIYYDNNVLVFTKYYSVNYEKKVTTLGNRELFYISSPFGLVAIIEATNGQKVRYYTCTDNLGSITAMTSTDGTKIQEFSYDAWGRPRTPAGWDYSQTVPNIFTDRGYTGHEHLDMFGLINMGGRIYEPILGRFLSADIVIQDGSSSQSYNKYSYCLNNPLKYTDPSGYVSTGTNNNSSINSISHAETNDSWDNVYGRGSYCFTGGGLLVQFGYQASNYMSGNRSVSDGGSALIINGSNGAVTSVHGGVYVRTPGYNSPNNIPKIEKNVNGETVITLPEADVVNATMFDQPTFTNGVVGGGISYNDNLSDWCITDAFCGGGSGFHNPVDNPYIYSSFGMRLHPISKEYKQHNGIDILRRNGNVNGKPIYSVTNGVVLNKFYNNTGGYTLQIKASNGDIYGYCHLKKGSYNHLQVNALVNQGDIIGNVGSTGGSTGPHLHLGIKRAGSFINPLIVHPEWKQW
jgi:RHS repeat-associated protein